MNARAVGTAAAGLLAAVALSAPAYAAPSYGSNGVFGVDAAASAGWATSFIPAGRYRVDQAPSMQPYQSAPGYWVRCSSFPCGPAFTDHVLATGHAVRDAPTFVDIAPTDAGVYLYNATLTRV